LVETSKKAEQILIKNKEDLKLEREKIINEVRAEMADLVAETTKKVVGKTLTSKDNADLVRESLKELEL